MFAKSSGTEISKKIPGYYAVNTYHSNNENGMTEDEAKEYINKMKQNPSKRPESDNLLAACAIAHVSQNEFIKLIKNFDDAEDMRYIKTVYDSNFNGIDEAKSKETERVIKKLKLKVIETDGTGNCALYSIANGKFYDWDHERYNGIDEMLKHGVSYNDMMKGILKYRESQNG